ncbi:MAG: response regulator [Planctomycetes bacterium]|nr:response regulator [Planctomycetota bacterium]MCC7172480.1 response regulator [Planctomycetota bacterium]
MIEPVVPQESVRVLVVDDNRDFADNVAELGASAGYEARIASSLREALGVLTREEIDVAVLDQRLPDGSGLDFLAAARRAQPDLVSVVVTAFASLDNTVAVLNEGAFAFVTKDQDPEELLDALRRAAETARLKRENRRLRTTQQGILRALPDLLLLVNERLEIQSVNREDPLFCPDDPSVLGRVTLTEVVAPVIRERLDAAALVRGALEHHRSTEASLTVRDESGTSRFFSVRASVVAQSPRSLVLVQIIDLSDRMQLERRLAETEGLAMLGRMASIVAHEIRNPIAGVRALAQVMLKRLPAGTEESENVQEMLQLADRMSATMADLLSWAKPKHAALAEVDVVALCRDVVREGRRWPASEGRHLDLELRVDEAHVVGERDRLFSALSNLTENALHAVPEGGHVVVRVLADATRCIIHVDDDGKGVALDDVGRLFEPFFTKKKGGTGLGLAIVKKVIDSHGGTVRPGKAPQLGGARFTVELPRESPARPTEEPDA